MKAKFAAILICLAAGFAAACGEESAQDSKLLETLRSDDFDAREAAKKKLVERGEAVRQLITAELEKKDLDPDYKDQLKSIASRLKDSDVLKNFDNPKRIDLELKDEPVSVALEKIKTQFNFGVTARDDAAKKKISLSIKGATFFEAVDAVRKAANLAYDRNEIMQVMFRRQGRLGKAAPAADVPTVIVMRENGDDTVIPAAAKGPVLIFFENIHYTMSRTINFGNGGKKGANSQKTFNISGYVMVEPEVRYSEIGLTNFRAIGPNKEAIPSSHVSMHNYWGGNEPKGGVQTYNFNASVNAQTDLPEKLDWKLEAKLQVPVKITEKRFDNLAEIVGKTQEFMGGTFTLNKIEQGGARGWKLAYTTTGALMEMGMNGRTARWTANGNEGMASGNPEYAPGMAMFDAQGNAIESNGYSGNGSNNTYRVEMDLVTEPKALVFRKPGESQTRNFEMEIPAVPVP